MELQIRSERLQLPTLLAQGVCPVRLVVLHLKEGVPLVLLVTDLPMSHPVTNT
jgi:hypothetical protein